MFSPPRRSKFNLVQQEAPKQHRIAAATGGLSLIYRQIKYNTNPRQALELRYGHYTKDHVFSPRPGMPLLAGRYRFLRILGRGQSSIFIKVEDQYQGGAVRAVKVLHVNYRGLGLQESDCIRRLNAADPYCTAPIMRLCNIFSFHGHYCMVFEILAPNPLTSYFKDLQPNVLLPTVRKVALRLLQAIGFLQNQNTIHADLKPANILLAKENDFGSLKVVDFGNSIRCVNEEISLYFCDFELQTLLYRAPEVIYGLPFGLEVDMWSLGCILGELFIDRPLFHGWNKMKVLEDVTDLLGPLPEEIFRRGKFYNEYQHFTSYHWERHAASTHDLMAKLECRDYAFADFLRLLLKYNPAERLTVANAARHPFLANEVPILPKPGESRLTTGLIDPIEYTQKPYIDKGIREICPSSVDLLGMGTGKTKKSQGDSGTQLNSLHPPPGKGRNCRFPEPELVVLENNQNRKAWSRDGNAAPDLERVSDPKIVCITPQEAQIDTEVGSSPIEMKTKVETSPSKPLRRVKKRQKNSTAECLQNDVSENLCKMPTDAALLNNVKKEEEKLSCSHSKLNTSEELPREKRNAKKIPTPLKSGKTKRKIRSKNGKILPAEMNNNYEIKAEAVSDDSETETSSVKERVPTKHRGQISERKLKAGEKRVQRVQSSKRTSRLDAENHSKMAGDSLHHIYDHCSNFVSVLSKQKSKSSCDHNYNTVCEGITSNIGLPFENEKSESRARMRSDDGKMLCSDSTDSINSMNVTGIQSSINLSKKQSTDRVSTVIDRQSPSTITYSDSSLSDSGKTSATEENEYESDSSDEKWKSTIQRKSSHHLSRTQTTMDQQIQALTTKHRVSFKTSTSRRSRNRQSGGPKPRNKSKKQEGTLVEKKGNKQCSSQGSNDSHESLISVSDMQDSTYAVSDMQDSRYAVSDMQDSAQFEFTNTKHRSKQAPGGNVSKKRKLAMTENASNQSPAQLLRVRHEHGSGRQRTRGRSSKIVSFVERSESRSSQDSDTTASEEEMTKVVRDTSPVCDEVILVCDETIM